MTTDRVGPGTAVRGGLMGLADAVPGVSGGTVALLLGIHPRLVQALSNLRPSLLREAWNTRRRDLVGTLAAADLGFLMVLGLGILVGLWAGASAVIGLLEAYPRGMAALFLALILTSIRAPLRHTDGSWRGFAIALVAALVAYLVTIAPATDAAPAMWMLPLLGAVAACAMILPGISGAYLLLLLGAYTTVITAVHEIDVVVIALVGAGAAVGILSFSHLLKHLLARHSADTHAAMVGLLVGSIGRLWPWRDATGFAQGTPIMPDTVHLMQVVLGLALGALLGWGLGSLSEKDSTVAAP